MLKPKPRKRLLPRLSLHVLLVALVSGRRSLSDLRGLLTPNRAVLKRHVAELVDCAPETLPALLTLVIHREGREEREGATRVTRGCASERAQRDRRVLRSTSRSSRSSRPSRFIFEARDSGGGPLIDRLPEGGVGRGCHGLVLARARTGKSRPV